LNARLERIRIAVPINPRGQYDWYQSTQWFTVKPPVVLSSKVKLQFVNSGLLDSGAFVQKVASVVERYAPHAKITFIGFQTPEYYFSQNLYLDSPYVQGNGTMYLPEGQLHTYDPQEYDRYHNLTTTTFRTSSFKVPLLQTRAKRIQTAVRGARSSPYTEYGRRVFMHDMNNIMHNAGVWSKRRRTS
jgi:hypothetical protein